MSTSNCTDSFLACDLDSNQLARGACPVKGCTNDINAQLAYYNKKHSLPFCSIHGLRIHRNTFVYYNGNSPAQREMAFKRNIAFNWHFFHAHFIQNTKKVGGHRLSWENSEDAVSYNVFTEMARNQHSLRQFLEEVTGARINNDVELYLWGHQIEFSSNKAPRYPLLDQLISKLEAGIRITTEPDIILRAPGESLVFIEAKFTSENTLSENKPAARGDKPKSVEEMINRYLDQNPYLVDDGPFAVENFPNVIYGQLFRNLVFCASAAKLEGIKHWAVVNLRAKKFMKSSPGHVENEVKKLLDSTHQNKFKHYTWENLYRRIKTEPALKNVAHYLETKSANCESAFLLD